MILLIGAGGHGKVIADILMKNKVQNILVYDLNPKLENLYGFKVIKEFPELEEGDAIIVGIGNNAIRKNNVQEIAGPFSQAIHPYSCVGAEVEIGEGTVIMAGAVINPFAKIGKHCIINTNASIDHDCVIGDFVHISPNATLSGGVTIGEGSHIGAGAVMIPGISVGNWVTIGAGAVIINDIPDHSTVVGNPGRIIKN